MDMRLIYLSFLFIHAAFCQTGFSEGNDNQEGDTEIESDASANLELSGGSNNEDPENKTQSSSKSLAAVTGEISGASNTQFSAKSQIAVGNTKPGPWSNQFGQGSAQSSLKNRFRNRKPGRRNRPGGRFGIGNRGQAQWKPQSPAPWMGGWFPGGRLDAAAGVNTQIRGEKNVQAQTSLQEETKAESEQGDDIESQASSQANAKNEGRNQFGGGFNGYRINAQLGL